MHVAVVGCTQPLPPAELPIPPPPALPPQLPPPPPPPQVLTDSWGVGRIRTDCSCPPCAPPPPPFHKQLSTTAVRGGPPRTLGQNCLQAFSQSKTFSGWFSPVVSQAKKFSTAPPPPPDPHTPKRSPPFFFWGRAVSSSTGAAAA